MPKITSLVTIDIGAPGFLLPIFRNHESANEEITQVIDEFDIVCGFRTFIPTDNCLRIPNSEHSIETGQISIWAFHDGEDKIHIGPPDVIRENVRDLIERRSLSNHLIVESELVLFCRLWNQYPNILLQTYNHLQKFSVASANTWRDTFVLLPAVRRDLKQRLGKKFNPRNTLVQTIHSTTYVLTTESSTAPIKELPEWRELAHIFGVDRFEIRAREKSQTAYPERSTDWGIFGIGGVARRVASQSPFNRMHHFMRKTGVVHVEGFANSQIDLRHDPLLRHLTIAVTHSDYKSINKLRQFLPSKATSTRHVINIRPIGFGTPKKGKPKPIDVLQNSGADALWIVSNHRQYQTGTYRNNLSASETACRYVRSLATTLITCQQYREGRQLLQESTEGTGFGLIGTIRFSAERDFYEVLQAVLYDMICEDAILRTAKRIAILWPMASSTIEGHYEVQLGHRRYNVEVIGCPRYFKSMNIVGLALGVLLSQRSASEFEDFCASLLSGYSDLVAYKPSKSLTIQIHGEKIRVHPTVSIEHHLAHHPTAGAAYDLFICNETITRRARNIADDREVAVIHYSELRRFMKKMFGVTPINQA